MPTVLISPEAFLNQPEASYARRLRDAGFDIRYPKNSTFTRGLGLEDETISELTDAAAVIAGGEHYFTRRVIEASRSLRVIARSGVGFDRVDIAAATERGVAVTITPTSNHEAVAEHMLAMLLGVTKNVALNDRTLRAGRWAQTLSAPVRGRTIGLVGLGRIGKSAAVRCAALDLRVIAHENFPDQEFVAKHGIALVEMDELLAQSDFVSLHCPLNGATQRMCDAAFFAQMKPGSVLINTARGGLVVETDLLAALQSGHLSGAGLDVFQHEPMLPTNPLSQLDCVVLSPHLAGTDTRSSEDMGLECANCIVMLSRDEWPEGAVVNADLRPRWKWSNGGETL
ncbi:MAG TPA: phosphoglycerate dehydrogenase [Pirellulales bacterium]|nr:phosphoglycerate dehydrogenase [Pirellulales bacterium]